MLAANCFFTSCPPLHQPLGATILDFSWSCKALVILFSRDRIWSRKNWILPSFTPQGAATGGGASVCQLALLPAALTGEPRHRKCWAEIRHESIVLGWFCSWKQKVEQATTETRWLLVWCMFYLILANISQKQALPFCWSPACLTPSFSQENLIAVFVELKEGSQKPWLSCCNSSYLQCWKELLLLLYQCYLQPSLCHTPFYQGCNKHGSYRTPVFVAMCFINTAVK